MTRPTALLTLFAVACLALVGCGSGDTDTPGGTNASGNDGKTLTIGFSQIGAESSWRTAETQSIRGEAEKRGVDLKFSDAQQKQENQIKALNAFIAQGVDAIILAPVVETGWEPVLKRARQRNIPVILVDRGVSVSDESLYTTLIASDFVAEGRMAGEWLAEKTGGTANIVELQGTPGAAPAIDRKKGFEQAIANHPGMKIIKSQTGEFTRAKGKEVMEAFLKSGGEPIDAGLRPQRRHGAGRDSGDRGGRQEARRRHPHRVDRRGEGGVRGDGRGEAQLHGRVQSAAGAGRVRRGREGRRRRDTAEEDHR